MLFVFYRCDLDLELPTRSGLGLGRTRVIETGFDVRVHVACFIFAITTFFFFFTTPAINITPYIGGGLGKGGFWDSVERLGNQSIDCP